MSPPIYFISDVHLGTGTIAEERIKQDRLIRLMHSAASRGGSIYFVGDLFDFWYEYRHALPRGYHRVLAVMDDLSSQGIPITYLAGNHDFAIGAFFRNDLGIAVVADDISFSHEGKTFYLYHGDGLAQKDTGYHILKAVLRNRLAQWLFRWLHPDLGFAIAHGTSHSSRKYTKSKKYGPVDGMLVEAERRISAGADYVIMGHRHRPTMQRIGNGIYVNLGDWIQHFTYAVYEDGALRMYTLRNDEFEVVENE